MDDTYYNCLHNAVTHAKSLQSKGFDWSGISLYNFKKIHEDIPCITPTCTHPLFDVDSFKKYKNGLIDTHKLYRDNMWSVVFHNLLFEHITANTSVRVLDVGCGESRQFRAMCKGIDTQKVSQYTTIDKESGKEYPLVPHKHITCDVFELTTDELMKYGGDYDILIMDIEPHGKEREVYDIVYPALKPQHIVICKCIGFIDLYGAGMANRFLIELRDRNILHSFWGSCDLSYLTRDVVAIVNKNGCIYRGNVIESEIQKHTYSHHDKNDPIPSQLKKGFLQYMLSDQ